MSLFNDTISDLQLRNVELSQKRFTWSNLQPTPILSRLDRTLISPHWSNYFPSITLTAMPMLVFYHLPLLLHFKHFAPIPKRLRMECFWFSNKSLPTLASAAWSEPTVAYSPFSAKASFLLKEAYEWHKQNFSGINVHLLNCYTFIDLFADIEQQRPLTTLERFMRVIVKERAYELSTILESCWRQRSRVQWLQLGDHNTRFFHCYASARRAKKQVRQLLVDNHTITDPSQILLAFSDFYKGVYAANNSMHSLSLSSLYDDSLDMSSLGMPFSRVEIKKAVYMLKDNKASGPDGIPNEFAKIFWELVQDDIVRDFNSFFLRELDLRNVNKAHIILLPKKEESLSMSDFRPISIISYLPKLISKVLSVRMKPFMSDLIHSNQTGFLANRFISENFITAREIAKHVHDDSSPVVLFKIDFKRAFDFVNWEFLLSTLRHRGFPSAFCSWIECLLSTATSSILIDGREGPSFKHFSGLRQGDPLSPYLFLLVADVLQVMVNAAATSVPFLLSPKLPYPFIMLQYADDTAVFSTARGSAIRTLFLTISLFSSVSGLSVNSHKSVFIPFNLEPATVLSIADLFQFRVSSLPLDYLGMPLTISRPNRNCFQTLIEKVDRRLQVWKTKLLS